MSIMTFHRNCISLKIMRSSNIDSRNVKRGACKDCDCDAFEYVKERGQACDYCQCPPTKHQRLDTVQSPSAANVIYHAPNIVQPRTDPLSDICNVSIRVDDPELLSLISSTSSNEQLKNSLEPSTSSQRPDPQLTQLSDIRRGISSRGPLLQNEVEKLRACIPDSWGKTLQARLNDGSVTQNDKNAMLRQVCHEMEEADMTAPIYVKHIAVLFVQKYPMFNGRFGSLHTSVENSIRACLKNRRRATRKIEARNKQCAQMISELDTTSIIDTKSDSIFTDVKEMLNKTRVDRKQEAPKLTASEFLAKYSSLQSKDMLLWEFGQLVNIPHWKLMSNWREALERIKKAKWFPELEYADENILSVDLLLKLPSHLKGRVGKCLLRVYPKDTPAESVTLSKTRVPQLVAIGNPKSPDLTITCYVDDVPVFTALAAEAIVLLIAVHWIFGINFCTIFKQQCIFFSAAIFAESSGELIRNELLNYKSIIHMMESLNILPKE
ncbi:uncharacterized protein LOC117173971 isoform X2 [Belonocnema kinseyi]|uniref:uncharacterized protein LOC117173971 isoform X2 n=1 Tax=Belonocnema kinseyi TaxID=2817044 RepID=UPI00143DC8AB|nr:uncharacterized protein LOC117173971 isoform X2 [Belonocnema kinseyi]